MRILDFQVKQVLEFDGHKLTGRVLDEQVEPSKHGRDGFGHGMVEGWVQCCPLVENILSVTPVAFYCMDSPLYGEPRKGLPSFWNSYQIIILLVI